MFCCLPAFDVFKQLFAHARLYYPYLRRLYDGGDDSEVDKNWAIATYCAVSLLSIFVTPNYEATLLFILFMGYYPILKYYLDQKKNRLLAWAIKLAVFNVAIVIFFLAFQYIFTSVDMLEGMEMFGKYAVLVLWAAANLFFFIYDYALTQLTDMYINWFRKKILRRK